MTAVALLFAIYMVRPSPFCVLDELDARSTNPTSTVRQDPAAVPGPFPVRHHHHNKRTIAMADVLYGITMQEQGVSKIVSVKFHKTDGAPKPPSAARWKRPPRSRRSRTRKIAWWTGRRPSNWRGIELTSAGIPPRKRTQAPQRGIAATKGPEHPLKGLGHSPRAFHPPGRPRAPSTFGLNLRGDRPGGVPRRFNKVTVRWAYSTSISWLVSQMSSW